MTTDLTRLLFRTSLTFLGVLVLLCPSFAQVTGRLTGNVVDSTGAVVPQATVSLYRVEGTEPVSQTTTTKNGDFTFDSVAPLTYRLVVEKPGFSTYEIRGVRVSPGVEAVYNNLVLALGQQIATVETAAKTESVNTANAEVTTTLTVEQLQRLPVLNREAAGLVITQAGITNNNAAFTVINGLRTSYSNVTLDGVSIQDGFIRRAALDNIPNRPFINQVSEFTLITSNASSRFGNGAAQIAFASPAGTNRFHGSAYYLGSPMSLNAQGWFDNASGSGAPTQRITKSNQGGGSAGGPIIKDRLLFYLNYEFLRRRDSFQQYSFALTSAGRAGQVYDANGQLVDLLGGAGVNPMVASLLKLEPLPNVTNPNVLAFAGITSTSPIGIYTYQQRSPLDRDNATARLDYIISSKHTVVGSYAFNRELDPVSASQYNSGPANTIRRHPNLLTLSLRSAFTPRLTNEIRGGFNLDHWDLANQQGRGNSLISFGLVEGVNPLDTTSANSANQGRRTKTVDVQDNAAYVFGRHNLQFGYQGEFVRINSYLQTLPTLTLGYNPTGYSPFTATPVPSLNARLQAVLAGAVSGYFARYYLSGSGSVLAPGTPLRTSPALDIHGVYLQDNWKPVAGLSVNMGLRYDYYSPVRERSSSLYAAQLVNGSVTDTLRAPITTYGLVRGNLYRADANNFAPNIGIAYDPFRTGRTVIRGGYTIKYVNDDYIAAIDGTLRNNFRLNTTTSLNAGAGRYFDILGNFAAPAAPTLSLPYQVQSGTEYVGVINPRLRTPYVQEWNIGVQREFASFVFDLRYIGNHATKMLRQVSLAPGFYLLSNYSNSSYNSLQFDASRRLSRNLQVQFNYTYSKVLSDTSANSAESLETYRVPTSLRLDRSRAPWDLTHAVKANFIYDLPFGAGHHYSTGPLKSILGGWSLSGILLRQSGSPFSILAGNLNSAANTANTSLSSADLAKAISFGVDGRGPYVIAAANRTSTPSAAGVYASGFDLPTSGSPGSLQLRRFNGPATFDMDLGLQKSFSFSEAQRLEFRAEAINVFNHPSFFVLDQSILDSNFGRDNIFQAFTPRRIQLSLTYRF